MILIVGDLHGDWGSLNNLINKKQPDVILQCGDFGWWPLMEIQRPVLYGQQKPWLLRGIKCKETEVYWCDGNHEDYHSLTNTDYDLVTYMKRGSVLELPDGRHVMFIGGAESTDRQYRTFGIDWFPEELITNADLDKALSFTGKIDIVISHTCPTEFDVSRNLDKFRDPSRIALSRILERFKPDLWYFGHWHKAQSGRHLNTYWKCLDYPKHGGKWWDFLK